MVLLTLARLSRFVRRQPACFFDPRNVATLSTLLVSTTMSTVQDCTPPEDTHMARPDDPIGSGAPKRTICLVASGGGHLEQLLFLSPLFSQHPHFFVTSLEGSPAITTREPQASVYTLPNLGVGLWRRRPFYFPVITLVSLFRLVRVFRKERPSLIISTGAGLCLPAFLLARLMGIRSVYIEAYARVHSVSLTGRLCYRLANLFLVQHRSLGDRLPRAVFGGSLYPNLPSEGAAP